MSNIDNQKYYFIVNPKAGQGEGNETFIKHIRGIAEKNNVKPVIYISEGIGDAEILARQICIENSSLPAEKMADEIRIYACGGDGTFNEVLNGIMGYENVAAGVIPIGTGNDFCRNFAEAGDFLDVENQIFGKSMKCDAIRYHGVLAGEEKTRYCANMFNIGFDCNVVDLTATLKNYPLIKGTMAYMMAVLVMMVKKKGADLRVEADGKVLHDGPLLLTAVSGGSYCGGGVKGMPLADLTDGLLNVNIIYNVPRIEFIKKFPYYAKGTHMELPDIGNILSHTMCKKVVVTPNQGTMRLCTDGEIVDAGRVEMEVVPGGFRFIVPAKADEDR